MEAQKILNLLDDSDNESSRFETRKRYVTTIDSSSFKYKSSILGDLVAAGANGVLKKCKDSGAFKIFIQFF